MIGALYLLLNVFSISFPLVRSFEPRIAYAKKWWALFPAILLVAIIFIIWDVLFTINGVWGFNPDYLVGVSLLHLPIEEWLFFICIPFACVFIYECTNYFIPSRPLKNWIVPFSYALVLALFITGIFNLDKLYTSITFISTSFLLLLMIRLNKRDFFDRMWVGYLFSLIPFILVNGILTGSYLESPIVWYNNEENLGIRLFTIPIEDSIYLMLMLFSITWIYESKLKRFPLTSS